MRDARTSGGTVFWTAASAETSSTSTVPRTQADRAPQRICSYSRERTWSVRNVRSLAGSTADFVPMASKSSIMRVAVPSSGTSTMARRCPPFPFRDASSEWSRKTLCIPVVPRTPKGNRPTRTVDRISL